MQYARGVVGATEGGLRLGLRHKLEKFHESGSGGVLKMLGRAPDRVGNGLCGYGGGAATPCFHFSNMLFDSSVTARSVSRSSVIDFATASSHARRGAMPDIISLAA